MSYKITVGLDRSIDSFSEDVDDTSCHLAIDLSPELLNVDSQQLQSLMHAAFHACVVAVTDQVHRHQEDIGRRYQKSPSKPRHFEGRSIGGPSNIADNRNNPANTSEHSGGTVSKVAESGTASDSSSDKPASRGQRRVIKSICKRLNIVPEVAADSHHFSLARITRRQASLLLDQLRHLEKNPVIRQRFLSQYVNASEGDQATCSTEEGCQRSCHARTA